jgi:hypothetical protein
VKGVDVLAAIVLGPGLCTVGDLALVIVALFVTLGGR